MVNTEFTHICSATVQNSSGTLLVSACGASGRRSVVAIRRMTVPRIALVMAIRQVDAAMRHFSFQHQSRSEEHTSELQSLMRITYAAFSFKKNKQYSHKTFTTST